MNKKENAEELKERLSLNSSLVRLQRSDIKHKIKGVGTYKVIKVN